MNGKVFIDDDKVYIRETKDYAKNAYFDSHA